MSPPASISAVLPAYNEEAVIRDVARRTAQALAALGMERYEVIVVDDGSSDRTAEEAGSLSGELAVRVISHPRNRGYGGALRTGFDAAECEAVWLMDSDGQFDPADISLLVPEYGDTTVVAGYRANRRDSVARRLYHWAFFRLVQLLFGPTTRDVNCAFKLFPRAVGAGLSSDGAMISTELILRARKAGYAIAEVAVPHHPRTAGTATGANPRVILRAFGELWRLRRDRRWLSTLQRPAAR